jgi:hypothetical protein
MAALGSPGITAADIFTPKNVYSVDMPANLDQILSEQEITEIVGYLATLKSP